MNFCLLFVFLCPATVCFLFFFFLRSQSPNAYLQQFFNTDSKCCPEHWDMSKPRPLPEEKAADKRSIKLQSGRPGLELLSGHMLDINHSVCQFHWDVNTKGPQSHENIEYIITKMRNDLRNESFGILKFHKFNLDIHQLSEKSHMSIYAEKAFEKL